MICYFLYWLIQFPFMFISPQKIRWLFLAKAAIVPPTWLALLIWAFVKVPLNSGILSQKAELSGSELSWAWLSALNSALGSFATLGVNIPDFTVRHNYPYHLAPTHAGQPKTEICEERKSVCLEVSPFNYNSKRHFRRQYVQFIIVPIAFTLASFIGIVVTSAGTTLYGQVLWDPLNLIDHWDNRAAAFFTSFAFALGTLGTNVSANSLSAGNDMTALCPRYINIRRGQVICAFLGGWALCPWEILARCVADTLGSHPRQLPHLLLSSATGFLSFMSGYTVFLGPITGIMITDVSPVAPFIHPYHWSKVSSLIVSSLSTGLYTARMSTFRQCIDLTGGIGIPMEQ